MLNCTDYFQTQVALLQRAVERHKYESTPGGSVVAETQRYIVEAITDLGGGPVGVMEISRQCGITRATVSQHCRTMVSEPAPRLIAHPISRGHWLYSVANAPDQRTGAEGDRSGAATGLASY